MTKSGYFHIDIYDCYVHIIISTNIKRCVNSRLKQLNLLKAADDFYDNSAGCFLGGTYYGDSSNYYLYFNESCLTHNCYNHEKGHVVDSILEDRAIPTKDEARCYLDGYISSKIQKFFKKKKIKIAN